MHIPRNAALALHSHLLATREHQTAVRRAASGTQTEVMSILVGGETRSPSSEGGAFWPRLSGRVLQVQPVVGGVRASRRRRHSHRQRRGSSGGCWLDWTSTLVHTWSWYLEDRGRAAAAGRYHTGHIFLVFPYRTRPNPNAQVQAASKRDVAQAHSHSHRTGLGTRIWVSWCTSSRRALHATVARRSPQGAQDGTRLAHLLLQVQLHPVSSAPVSLACSVQRVVLSESSIHTGAQAATVRTDA